MPNSNQKAYFCRVFFEQGFPACTICEFPPIEDALVFDLAAKKFQPGCIDLFEAQGQTFLLCTTPYRMQILDLQCVNGMYNSPRLIRICFSPADSFEFGSFPNCETFLDVCSNYAGFLKYIGQRKFDLPGCDCKWDVNAASYLWIWRFLT